jgi:LAO/AO transport system kinase
MSEPTTLDDYVEGVLGGDRQVLARAITLVESRRPDHAELASELISTLLPRAGGANRIGITGVPGVGKSTFIDEFGLALCVADHRVAVLAVDPTSQRTGGAILGDKTRMERLVNEDNAFVRPSPAGGMLGGVTRTTRETIVVCEAAGFDVVLVETVGVGQSETIVAEMVDFFLVLMLAGAGDELQGIKKGVLELADLVAVNKADADNVDRARTAAADYRMALHLTQPASPNWTPPVLTCSALEGTGLDEIWSQVASHNTKLTATGELQANRRSQEIRWMWAMVDDRLRADLRTDPAVSDLISGLEEAVREGSLPAGLAADRILDAFAASHGT